MKRLTCILLLLASCGKPSAEIKSYHVDKGDHYCSPREVREVTETLNFQFFVDESWQYEVETSGINKVVGISDGTDHMKNSVRLGWMDNNGQLEAYIYVHNGDKDRHVSEKICNLSYGWHSAEIGIMIDNYYVIVDGICRSVDRNNKSQVHLMLYPYFGGQCTAPHNINFKFKF